MKEVLILSKGNICVIMGNVTEDYRDDYLIGFEKQINRMGYNTTIFSMPLLNQLKTLGEEAVYDLVDFDDYDGVMFFEKSFSQQKALAKHLQKQIHDKCTKPVVVVGNSTLFTDVFPGDYGRNVEHLTDHLIEQHGCELIYMLGGQPGHPTGADKAFAASLKKHNIEFSDDNIFYGGFWRECADILAKDIAYGSVEKPDAVVCYSDTIAFFFIKALAQYGIRVPEEILVAGFGGEKCSQNGIISITTSSCDAEYTGRMAAGCLGSLITGEEQPVINRPRVSLFTGDSCGCGSVYNSDLRLRLELHEKRSTENMWYTNSELSERLMSCRSYMELTEVFMRTHYLVVDKCLMSVSLRLDDVLSRCIFMTDNIGDKNFDEFESAAIIPFSFYNISRPKNLYVLPICFNGKMYGHVAVGYDVPVVYSGNLKEYIKSLGIALEILEERIDMQKAAETTVVMSDEEKKNTSTLFVYEGDTLHRIEADSVYYFEVDEGVNYAVLQSGRYEARITLQQLEEMFDSNRFLRISKSMLLNLKKVKSHAPGTDRTIIVTLDNDMTVRVSRKCAPDFKAAIANN